ncbi:hypothetical protein J2Y63_006938 [Shinella sp. BE166]|uniref:hypothetical protein n=1 Tax=Shinella sp. BE166 TaxID=3373918 RepID=UPI003EB6DA04
MKMSGLALNADTVELSSDVEADGAWKLARLDAIAQMDDPAIRENNRYVLGHMVGTSEDYDDARFLLTFSSMVLLKDAAWQRGKLDAQSEAVRSGYIRDPRTGMLWRLHAVPSGKE